MPPGRPALLGQASSSSRTNLPATDSPSPVRWTGALSCLGRGGRARARIKLDSHCHDAAGAAECGLRSPAATQLALAKNEFESGCLFQVLGVPGEVTGKSQRSRFKLLPSSRPAA